VNDLTVLAHITVLEVRLGLPAHDLVGGLQCPCPVVGVDQFDHRATDDFRRRVAEDAFERGTDVNVTPFNVNHADRVEQKIHDVGESVVVEFHHVLACGSRGR